MLEEEYQQRRVLPPHLKKAPEPTPVFEYSIRPAIAADLPHIREIYNHYVLNSTVTFDEKPMTIVALRKKFAAVEKLGFPYIVAESPSGQILGYAYVYPWKEKAAYRYTVENSIYLGPASTGKGLGKVLLGELITRSKAAGVKEIIAVIADKGAEGSIKIHKDYGFKDVGHMGKVGFKYDRWLGTVMMELNLRKR